MKSVWNLLFILLLFPFRIYLALDVSFLACIKDRWGGLFFSSSLYILSLCLLLLRILFSGFALHVVSYQSFARMWKLYSVDLGLFLSWGLATCTRDLNRFQVFRGNSSVIVCFSKIELNLLNSNFKRVSCMVYIQLLLLTKNKYISNIVFVLVLL